MLQSFDFIQSTQFPKNIHKLCTAQFIFISMQLTMTQANLILRLPVIAKTIGLNASGSKSSQLDGDKLTAKHSFLHSVVSLDTQQFTKTHSIKYS